MYLCLCVSVCLRVCVYKFASHTLQQGFVVRCLKSIDQMLPISLIELSGA